MAKFNCPEGATPIDDCSGLIPRGILTQNDLNRIETENIYDAKKKYLEKKVNNPALWFNIETLKTIHQAMFGKVWTWAGNFRSSKTSIGIEPYLIPSRLSELCADVSAWSHDAVDLTFLEQAARVHHRLVLIHPFENGNGRFSRLIADRYLIAYGCPHPNWPSLQEKSGARDAYIKSLKEADRYDYDPLIKLMHDWDAKDPSLSELLTLPAYQRALSTQKRLAIIHALLRRGGNINERTNNGQYPLHIAIQKNIQDIAFELIRCGADVTLRNKPGYDPFELAINRGLFEIAQAICKAGYPYTRNIPISPKIKHDMLYKFEQEYLK